MNNPQAIDYHSGKNLSLCPVRQKIFEKIKQDTEMHLSLIKKMPELITEKVTVTLTGGVLRDFLLKPEDIKDLDVHVDFNIGARDKAEYIKLFNTVPLSYQMSIFESFRKSIPEDIKVDFNVGEFSDGKFWDLIFKKKEVSRYDKDFNFIDSVEEKAKSASEKLFSSYSEKIKALIITKVFEFHYTNVLKNSNVFFKDLFASGDLNFNLQSLKEEFSSSDANDIFKKINSVDVGETERVRAKRVESGNKMMSYNLISGICSIFKFNPGQEFNYSQDLILTLFNDEKFIDSFDWDICKMMVPVSSSGGNLNGSLRNLEVFLNDIQMSSKVKRHLDEKIMSYNFFDLDFSNKKDRITDRIEKMTDKFPDFKPKFICNGVDVMNFTMEKEPETKAIVTESLVLINSFVKSIFIEKGFTKLTSKVSTDNISNDDEKDYKI